MNKSERDALVKRYTQGHSVVVEALAGITPAELDARHDGWTAPMPIGRAKAPTAKAAATLPKTGSRSTPPTATTSKYGARAAGVERSRSRTLRDNGHCVSGRGRV